MEFVSERSTDRHDASQFASGQPELDDWLRRSARDSDGRNLTRTYVWHRGDGIVIAYCTLAPYLIDREQLSKKRARGLPNRIPCYLLARLAVHADEQGRRLGSTVLMEALVRVAEHAEDIGGRFVVVDAIDDRAASFYAHHGFERLPGGEGRLVLPVKDVQAAIDGD